MITTNTFRSGLILASYLVVSAACAQTPPPDTAAVIEVHRDGTVTVKAGEGSAEAQECGIGPESKNRCRGFGKEGQILKMETLTIFRTEGSNCIIIVNPVSGVATQYCW